MSSTPLSLFHHLLLLLLLVQASADSALNKPSECTTNAAGACHDVHHSLTLKLVAIVSILTASAVGVCLPLFTRSFPALHPDRAPFAIVKAFSSGVILATGYMHVLPDSFDDLGSPCLPERPWRRFPFTGFVAMLSAVATLMVDSLAMSFYRKVRVVGKGEVDEAEDGLVVVAEADGKGGDVLRRNRVIAQV
ncbi:Fe(2+) transport protein 1 [Acorus calamus]|uniref:Fe(2+) transport protein 1 n=1 Tax=Acorus calamus TaxID=4465 RepID=A0AAV9FFZ1_ACOCL|nr:Fe(2+) transport protein 1 [Acorus calamus]